MNQFSCKVVAVLALALSPGCALLASANASHSHISPCVDEMGFSVADLVLAAASTAIVAGTGALDDSPAWMAVPAVFVTSGVVGSIYVHKCRGDLRGKPTGPMPVYPDPPLTPARASDLPDATLEELGPPPPPSPEESPPAAPPGDPRLQLRPDSALARPLPPAAAEGDDRRQIMCGRELPGTCPPGTACHLVADGSGHCKPVPTRPPGVE